MNPGAVKTGGYLISTLSVLLLGIVSWKSAAEHPPMLLCLIGGMAASVAGMYLRWLSYQIEEKRRPETDAPQAGTKPR